LAWYYLYPKQWKAWRQACVTEAVRSIADEARKQRPGLIVSAAVFPNYSVASLDKGQAWHTWLQAGILDAACPMTYSTSTKQFSLQVRDAVAHSHGKPIVPGVGAWQMPAQSAIAKGKLCRGLGTSGVNFFSYDGMTRFGRTEAYLAKVAGALFKTAPERPNWQRAEMLPLAETEPTLTSEAPLITPPTDERFSGRPR
jgi:uncharacterized lipoprotein YddW (UPF0748 family)